MEGGSPSSAITATVTIEVRSNSTLDINECTSCNVSPPDENNPSPGWNKTTYINTSGTITIKVTATGGTDTKDLDTALSTDNNN